VAQLLTEKIMIKVPRDIVQKLDAIAKPRLQSRSDVIREAVLLYLSAKNSQDPVA